MVDIMKAAATNGTLSSILPSLSFISIVFSSFLFPDIYLLILFSFFCVANKAEKKAKSSRKKGEKKKEVKKVKFPEGYSFFQKCFGLTEPVVFRVLKQMVDGPLGSVEGADLIKKARDTRSDISCSFHLV